MNAAVAVPYPNSLHSTIVSFTWRFMGSYKWVISISPLTGVIIVVALLKTPLITTHEPPSRP